MHCARCSSTSPAPLRGSIDAVHGGCCQGWAFDPASASPVEVELFIDGQPAGRARADLHRVDLEREGMGNGCYGFSIGIPAALHDGRHHHMEARGRGGCIIAARASMQIVPRLTPAEFDRRAPWVDSDNATFERELERLRQKGAVEPDTETRLRFFREHGWLKLEQVVPHALIDKVLDDVEQAWCDLPPQLVLSNALTAPTPMSEVTNLAGFRDTSVRYLDFHNASEADAEIMMLPEVLRFAEACFGEKIAAMQTLLFENGTQQASHQDFAFVHSLRPACLMGAWVALEDARVDAGPLFYWDRSHRAVPKYAFDDGSVLAEGDGPHVRAFEKLLGERLPRTWIDATELHTAQGRLADLALGAGAWRHAAQQPDVNTSQHSFALHHPGSLPLRQACPERTSIDNIAQRRCLLWLAA